MLAAKEIKEEAYETVTLQAQSSGEDGKKSLGTVPVVPKIVDRPINIDTKNLDDRVIDIAEKAIREALTNYGSNQTKLFVCCMIQKSLYDLLVSISRNDMGIKAPSKDAIFQNLGESFLVQNVRKVLRRDLAELAPAVKLVVETATKTFSRVMKSDASAFPPWLFSSASENLSLESENVRRKARRKPKE